MPALPYFYFIFPPFCLIWMVPMFMETLLSINVGAAVLKIDNNQILKYKSIFEFSVVIFLMKTLSFAVSLGVVVLITYNIPSMTAIYSEWGIAQEKAYFQFFIFIIMSITLYCVLLIPLHLYFKKLLSDAVKRIKLFFFFYITSVVTWVIFLCYHLATILAGVS